MSRERDLAQAIVARLSAGSPTSDEVSIAFEELDALPPDVVRAALEPWVGPAPDLDRLDDAIRTVHGLPPRPLALCTLSVVKDADILDLGPIVEAQLRLAGKSWDGLDLEPEERLDGEVEGSFAGTLEHRVLADAGAEKRAPLFDLLLFAGDSGLVFHSGTATQAGAVAYGRVEMSDRRARSAIQAVLDASPAADGAEQGSTTAAPEPTEDHAPAAPNAKRATKATRPSARAAANKTTAKAATKKASAARKTTAAKKVSTAKKATVANKSAKIAKKTATKKPS